MPDARPLWMQLATCCEGACISAHYSLEVIHLLQRHLQRFTALADLQAELEQQRLIAQAAIDSGDWMPDPYPIVPVPETHR